jgi:hypothetical protein
MQQRSVVQVIQQATAVAVALSLVIGVGLAVWIGALNPELEPGELVRVGLYLIALYGGIHLVGLGGGAAVALLLGYRPGARHFLAMALGFWVLLNGALRHISAVQILSVTPHITVVGLLDAVCVALAAALVALGIASGERRPMLRALTGAVLLFVLLEMVAAVHEPPRARNVARELPPILAKTSPVKLDANADAFAGSRLVVLGFDGLSWEVLLPLLEEGRLPGFRTLLEGAAYGNLATHPFTKSPLIWETISTGQAPEHHGIGHHVHFEVPGLHQRIRHLPYFPLCNSPMALRRLLTYTAPWAPWAVVGANATDARAARFWEVAQRSGMSVGVYDWMNTTPAAPIRPFLHGYGSVPPRMFPPDLEIGMPPLPTAANTLHVGLGGVQRQLPRQRAIYDRFRRLSVRHHPDLLLYYTHFGDAVNHVNWRDEAWGHHFFISGLTYPDYLPGPPVRLVMDFLDDVVADVLSRTTEGTTVAVVSDHGFDFRGYEHDNGPPGVFILRGPGIRSGPFEGASIYDVTPTFLNLLGLAVAQDMPGHPVDVALPGGPLDRPIARVATYGPPLPTLAAGEPDPSDVRAHQEYLRALGYVN